MFVDKVKIHIKAGNGGDGCVSFHREKYVSAGGPDGGDGGNGGNIYFCADENMRTLLDFRYQKKFAAKNGENGKNKNMRGKNGEDIIIRVPAGTVIYDAKTNKIAYDVWGNEKKLVLRGGHGGKGNARFATPTRQAPKFATPGTKTIGHDIILELKSIADVGLIGFPNVGKSTLLSVITSANPKIADYHFTTLKPNLGVVSGYGDSSFILADIPGIIEGASEGAGLGHEFLRHIERTRMLIHVIDIAGTEGRDPVEDYHKVRDELNKYSPELSKKPEIVAANKSDIPGFELNLEALNKELNVPVFAISAVTGSGVKGLFAEASRMLKSLPIPDILEEESVIENWHLKSEAEFEIQTQEDGVFLVSGSAVDLIFERINPNDEQSMRHFQKLLIDFGIIAKLRESGAKDGDSVILNDLEFEFFN